MLRAELSMSMASAWKRSEKRGHWNEKDMVGRGQRIRWDACWAAGRYRQKEAGVVARPTPGKKTGEYPRRESNPQPPDDQPVEV